jgi:uncharacterized damage-inducible protein DinB
MEMRRIDKPQAGEYTPYTIMYIDLVPDDGLVLEHLRTSETALLDFIRAFPNEKLSVPWKAGEWTIKEILVHIIDTERIFAYRALRIARNDMTELPGFEQDDYVSYSAANNRELEDILAEYQTVRAATISLFQSLTDEALLRQGRSGGNPLSVRAALYIIAGHEPYHVVSIRENYG